MAVAFLLLLSWSVVDHDLLGHASYDFAGHEDMITPIFTTEQLEYLAQVFGIDPIGGAMHVSDGIIVNNRKQYVWIKTDDGPVQWAVDANWERIKKMSPEKLSVVKPQGKFIYEDVE